ncbi:serine-rich adhesin for platelets [Oncorhynchus tshawytscha]|uniref:serine-rich adhesin for platelets n=1 Tax=Oncorhynchus tshawytscha TaxID=74940 RepID=UPI001C3E1D6E|nr:serine-rich adhesin for platelets [Oncorhynchus tshawytscha]
MSSPSSSNTADSAATMAGRRSCVNSLWSGTERVRIGERLKATLAGILELDLLRGQHLDMIDAELDLKDTSSTDTTVTVITDQQEENLESAASDGSATSRRQQVPSSPSETVLPCHTSTLDKDSGGNFGGDGPVRSRVDGDNSRCSTLSWDAPSDLLLPPDLDGAVQLDYYSRPSSGFYSVSGSSLSDSCYSVSSEASLAQGGPVKGGLVRAGPGPPSGGAFRLWEQRALSADHRDTQWPEATQQPRTQSIEETTEITDRRPVSTVDLEMNSLFFLSDLCASLGDPHAGSLLPLPDLRPQLDPRFCSDLVSRRTKEVYPYPSPLHAVALQSPLFTYSQDPSPSPRLSPSPDSSTQAEESQSTPLFRPPQPPQPSTFTQLEQYITRLARQYRSRIAPPDTTLTAIPRQGSHRGPRTPGHGSTQSLSAFENRSTPSNQTGGSVTPCKSFLGNSARVSLSSISKKASRNSINLGHLPSVTGEDLKINLHLNLSLNLSPNLNKNLGLDSNSKEGISTSGVLKSDHATPTASPSPSTSSLSSAATPTPALRVRPRISTCPSNLNHRSSLEVTGSGAGSGLGFSRSLDWSRLDSSPGKVTMSQLSVNAPDASPSMLSEDSAMVGEISRLSGLPRAVVVGLMEQGVELDVDCFQSDTERKGQGSEFKGQSSSPSSRQTGRNDHQSHHDDYSSVRHLHASNETDLDPQRPIHLSLSVTNSSSSHSSSPNHPYQSTSTHPSTHHHVTHHHTHTFHCQQTPSPSDPSSSTASSPSSRDHPRVHSPPRPLQPSPLATTPFSVFRRDDPFQCSLPRISDSSSPQGGGIRPRGGSLRQCAGGGGAEEENKERWKREGIRRKKEIYQKEKQQANKETERRQKESSASKRKGKGGGGGWDKRSSSLRLSRQALFRSESQREVLDPRALKEEYLRGAQWTSSLDIGRVHRTSNASAPHRSSNASARQCTAAVTPVHRSSSNTSVPQQYRQCNASAPQQ